MAKLVLTPENQIQRLNQLLNFNETLKDLSLQNLTQRPHAKSWNVLEVLEHLKNAYTPYEEKIERVMAQLVESHEAPWEYRPGFWNRFLIEGQRPKGMKRSFKIKTLKKFEPLPIELPSEKEIALVFEGFFEAYNSLKQAILESRTKKIRHKKISSAIGPIVKFHLPEAFEFLICHAERHKVQIELILESQNKS